MKNTKTLSIATGHHDPEIQEIIRKADLEITEHASESAKHFAQTNRPHPFDDNLVHYTGGIKTRCEKLGTEIAIRLQAKGHIPQGKLDIDNHKEHDANYEKEITAKEHQNRNDRFELGKFNSKDFFTVLFWVGILTAIILLGEIFFNTGAFQVTGENMLFALVISIGISITVALSTHIVPFLYKSAKNAFQRRMVVLISLLIMTILFTALAILRSTYFSIHNVTINPFYFVIINLVFFIVSCLISYFILPPWEKIKVIAHRFRLHNIISKREKEIEKLKEERTKLKVAITEKTKDRLIIIHYAGYIGNIIRKIYSHAVEVFKITNMSFRSDQKTPKCFSDVLPEPDIEDISLLLNRKAS
jgi:hypothetical protein